MSNVWDNLEDELCDFCEIDVGIKLGPNGPIYLCNDRMCEQAYNVYQDFMNNITEEELKEYNESKEKIRKAEEEKAKKRNEEREKNMKKLYPICCESCRIGTSKVTEDEIESQKEKYDGIYICKSCEKRIEAINKDNEFFDSIGNKLMVSRDGLYYHDGKRIMPPDTPFLGFAGRWFLIETIHDRYVTNNLFVSSSFSKILGEQINDDKIYIKNIKSISKKEADEFREAKKVADKLSE
ncbi:MAG: hypothetical protein ACOC2W_02085 [bacterium]